MNKIDKLEQIDILIKKFLCCIPIKNIDFIILKNLTWEEQLSLLNKTINSNLNKDFPIKVDYQRQFLKIIISTLESFGLEVHDSIYQNYCELLGKSSERENFKHYVCDSNNVISLKENNSFISEGTTGLCSWQAAFALSEWCLANKNYLRNKHVLELGSGIGLLGIVLSKYCQCQTVTLTDCHPTVIKVLIENISLNLSQKKNQEKDLTFQSYNPQELLNKNFGKHFNDSSHAVCEQTLKNSEINSKNSVKQNEKFRTIFKNSYGENFKKVQNSDLKNCETLKKSEVINNFDESKPNFSDECIEDLNGKNSGTFIEKKCRTTSENCAKDSNSGAFFENTGTLNNKCSDDQINSECKKVLAHQNFGVLKQYSLENSKNYSNLDNECSKICDIQFCDNSELLTPAVSEKVDKNFLCAFQNLIFSEIFNNTHVTVLNLPWQEIGNPDFYSGSPNVVLAADVVYDSTVFEPLCSAIKFYLTNKNSEVILACTERNNDTLQHFLDIIKSENLNLNELEPEPSKIFFWNTDSPIRIFQISS